MRQARAVSVTGINSHMLPQPVRRGACAGRSKISRQVQQKGRCLAARVELVWGLFCRKVTTYALARILMSATALDSLSLRPSVQAALGEARAELARLYENRLVKVILYGSHARGEAHQESDVDVLFVLQGDFSFTDEVKRTNPLVSQILLKHHELLALLPFASIRLHDPLHPLMINVRKEGVEL